jgi:glucosamine-phosphate N-acetyltransferase
MVEIRELTRKDISQQLIDILHDAFKHDKISVSTAKNRFVFRLMCRTHTFGIYLDQQLIGIASVIVEKKMFKLKKPFVAHVEDVAIHREHRGFGYGKQLMHHLIEFARKRDCYKVVLYCSLDNIEFYKRCGMRHTSNLMRKDLE